MFFKDAFEREIKTFEKTLDKARSKVERGFRFLKDPLFFAERELRKKLKENDEAIPNQVKKPTQTPTVRWVFQMFENVLLLTVVENDSEKTLLGI